MAELAADVVAYGLVAGLSGSAFLATVFLLATSDAVRSALGLLVGVVLALGVAAAVAAIVADVIIGAGGSLVVATLLKLALGLFLLVMAWRVRPSAGVGPALQAKAQGLETKLMGVGPRQALRIGLGVAVLPKRLGATLLAGASIGAAETTPIQGAAALGLFLIAATVLIWGTVLVFIAGGERAQTGIDQARRWVVDHIEAIAFVLALAFGVLLTAQALVELVA